MTDAPNDPYLAVLEAAELALPGNEAIASARSYFNVGEIDDMTDFLLIAFAESDVTPPSNLIVFVREEIAAANADDPFYARWPQRFAQFTL